MPRRIYRNKRKEPLPPGVYEYLLLGDQTIFPIWDGMTMTRLPELWAELREKLLDAWVAEHPGTRPFGWWLFEAPKVKKVPAEWKGTRVAGRLIVPRKKIGGSGVEAWKVQNVAPSFVRGIPILSGCDAADPPIYESEAQYLRRLRLLSKDEARRVPKKMFKPEVIEVEPLQDDGFDDLVVTYAPTVAEMNGN